MATENTPLKNPEEEEEYYYEDEGYGFSTTTKYLLGALASILCIGCLYMLIFFLPLLYIPESRTLTGIIKVIDSQHELTPLSPERVRELGLHKFRLLHNDDDDEDADLIEDIENNYENPELEIPNQLKNSHKKSQVERLIMIGDIHGQYKELKLLLKNIKYNPIKDHLMFLGDFISKGPDSLEVLNFAIKNNVGCVLGNHEYYALQNYAQFHNLQSPFFVNLADNKTTPIPERFVEITNKFNNDPEYLMAKKLQPQHIEYINNCPVIKKLGKVPFHKPLVNNGTSKYVNGVAVHAGLRWDIYDDLEEQNPLNCLEMRKLLPPFYNETTDDPHAPGAIGWAGKWKEQSNLLPRSERLSIYYGHDARKGLRLKKYTKGLDSRCFAGGHLTAMVLWKEEVVTGKKSHFLYKEQGFQVPC